MKNVTVDLKKIMGKIKPMHAVNNGPVISRGITNLKLFQEAGIPFVRTHDSSFFAGYGGEHTVDIPAVFPDFDADPYDEKSYDFDCTDKYLGEIEEGGSAVFYRLGVKIEHTVKKYHIHPPKDFKKWAVICEHIIRHYNEGWANGFHMGIVYWEIWNEPNLANKCWTGTNEEFFKLYETAAKHLKSTFPELKIGGPAITSPWSNEFFEGFMKYAQEKEIPMDFFSWHGYRSEPVMFTEDVNEVDRVLKKYGYQHIESILNEWNYLRVEGWTSGEVMKYNYKVMRSLKGASFIAGAMCTCQNTSIDMLMYYDARPSAFNGMFDSYTLEPYKGYYPFHMWNELYKLEGQAESLSDFGEVYSCAATNGDEAAILLTYFNDYDGDECIKCKLNLKGFDLSCGAKAEFYLLDENNNEELVREEIYYSSEFSPVIEMKLYTTVLVKISKTEL